MLLPSRSQLRQALELAERSCSCESYYRYTCGKCRRIAEGDLTPALQAALDMGLITYEGYGGPHLTADGRFLLKAIREEV